MRVNITDPKGNWDRAKTGKGKFAGRLIKALEKQGIEIVQGVDQEADIALHIGRVHFVPKARRQVLRLGPAHVNTSFPYKRLNKEKLVSARRADAIIYQSQYSKTVCEKFIFKPDVPSAIIFNGADIDEMQAIEPHHSDYGVNIMAATRVWLPQKRLKTIVRAFREADIKDSCLWICGDVGKYRKYSADNVKMPGVLPFQSLASIYRLCPVFVHIVYLDACPNSVVEALAAGCGVVCTDQGGTREIVSGCGLVLKDKPYNFKPIDLYKPPKLSVETLSGATKWLINQMTLLHSPLFSTSHIDINTIASQYIKFFESIL